MIRALLLIVAALATFALAFVYLRFEHDVESLYGIGPLFDPAREGNVPTWFSSALLLGSAIALPRSAGPTGAAGWCSPRSSAWPRSMRRRTSTSC